MVGSGFNLWIDKMFKRNKKIANVSITVLITQYIRKSIINWFKKKYGSIMGIMRRLIGCLTVYKQPNKMLNHDIIESFFYKKLID